MGRPKKIEDEVIVKEQTLHDKYRTIVNNALINNAVSNFHYSIAMEMLRYVEGKIGHSLGLNMNCGSCLLDLIKMFAQFEEKEKE